MSRWLRIYLALIAVDILAVVMALLVVGELDSPPAYAVYAVGAITAVVGTIWLLPKAESDTWRGLTRRQRIELEDKARATTAQMISGIGLIATLAITLFQVNATRDSSRETLRLTNQGLLDDRLAGAVDQLGATDSKDRPLIEVRLGGIYALGAFASAGDNATRVASGVLSAYLRTNGRPLRSARLPDQPCAVTGTRSPPDIAAAIDVLRDLHPADGAEDRAPRIDLSGADLRGADLGGIELTFARLIDTRLTGATLVGSDLRDAFMEGVDAAGACFASADLRGADVRTANVQRASFERAKIAEDTFTGDTNLCGATFEGATGPGPDVGPCP